MTSKRDVVAIVTELVMLYPAAKISAGLIDAYVARLGDLPVEYLRVAAADCVDKCKWFPTVAEIRESCASLMIGAKGFKPALEAWGEVKKTIARCGSYRDPQFSDPIIAATVRAMGWKDLCASKVDDEPSDRARFIELYDQYCRREVEQIRMSPEVRQISERQAGVRKEMYALAASFSDPKRLSGGVVLSGANIPATSPANRASVNAESDAR